MVGWWKKILTEEFDFKESCRIRMWGRDERRQVRGQIRVHVGEIRSRTAQRKRCGGQWEVGSGGQPGQQCTSPYRGGEPWKLWIVVQTWKTGFRYCAHVIYRMDGKENEIGGRKPVSDGNEVSAGLRPLWESMETYKPTPSPQKNLCTYETVHIISWGDLQL